MWSDYTWIVVCGCLAAFFTAYGIGANDVANAFGSSVAARTLTMRQALLIATVCEFSGSVLLGGEVTRTVASGIAKLASFDSEPEIYMYGMLCALVSSGTWLLLATYLELPVSTTHSIAGAVMGFAFVYGGPKAVVWLEPQDNFPYMRGMVPIVVSWFISPLISSLASALLFFIVRTAILRRENSLELAFWALPVLVLFTVFINVYFVLDKGADSRISWSSNKSAWVSACIAGGCTLLTVLVGMPLVRQYVYTDLDIRRRQQLAELESQMKADGGGSARVSGRRSPGAGAGAGVAGSMRAPSRSARSVAASGQRSAGGAATAAATGGGGGGDGGSSPSWLRRSGSGPPPVAAVTAVAGGVPAPGFASPFVEYKSYHSGKQQPQAPRAPSMAGSGTAPSRLSPYGSFSRTAQTNGEAAATGLAKQPTLGRSSASETPRGGSPPPMAPPVVLEAGTAAVETAAAMPGDGSRGSRSALQSPPRQQEEQQQQQQQGRQLLRGIERDVGTAAAALDGAAGGSPPPPARLGAAEGRGSDGPPQPAAAPPPQGDGDGGGEVQSAGQQGHGGDLQEMGQRREHEGQVLQPCQPALAQAYYEGPAHELQVQQQQQLQRMQQLQFQQQHLLQQQQLWQHQQQQGQGCGVGAGYGSYYPHLQQQQQDWAAIQLQQQLQLQQQQHVDWQGQQYHQQPQLQQPYAFPYQQQHNHQPQDVQWQRPPGSMSQSQRSLNSRSGQPYPYGNGYAYGNAITYGGGPSRLAPPGPIAESLEWGRKSSSQAAEGDYDEKDPATPGMPAGANPGNVQWQNTFDQLKAIVLRGTNVNVHEAIAADTATQRIHTHAEVFDPATEDAFKYLQVVTAICDSFSHGANDVANSVGPFTAIWYIYRNQRIDYMAQLPIWILVLGGAGIVVGLATYGYNIIRAIGVRLSVITPSRGFCIELSTAMVVALASKYGLPISTTHCQVGATAGMGLMEGSSGLHWRLALQFFTGWVVTLLLTGLLSAALFAAGAFAPCIQQGRDIAKYEQALLEMTTKLDLLLNRTNYAARVDPATWGNFSAALNQSLAGSLQRAQLAMASGSSTATRPVQHTAAADMLAFAGNAVQTYLNNSLPYIGGMSAAGQVLPRRP